MNPLSQSTRAAVLLAIHNATSASMDSMEPQAAFKAIVSQITTQLGIDAASILLLHGDRLDCVARFGFHTQDTHLINLGLAADDVGRLALERKTILIADLNQSDLKFSRTQLVESEKFVTYYGVPIIEKDEFLGLLEVYQHTPITFAAEMLNFLGELATRTSVALEKAKAFENLQRAHLELNLAYEATIEGWLRVLDIRDHEIASRTQRVTALALMLARAMYIFNEAELVTLRRGATLFGIGIMGIPDTILHKPGPLTEEEQAILRMEPVYAYEMLTPIAYLRQAAEIPYSYHENWDGTGYPRGLKGEEIPLGARIVAVVATWDTLQSNLPYRKALEQEAALDQLREQSGKKFDPQVVNAFVELMSK